MENRGHTYQATPRYDPGKSVQTPNDFDGDVFLSYLVALLLLIYLQSSWLAMLFVV